MVRRAGEWLIHAGDRKKYISKYKSSRRRKYIKRGGSSNNNKQPVKKLVSAEAYKDMCKYNTYDIYKVNLFAHH